VPRTPLWKQIAQWICAILGFGTRLLEGEGAGEAGQWALGARTGGGVGPRRSEGAQRKRSRGSRRKEEEGKGKTGAPPGVVGVAERERKSAAGSCARKEEDGLSVGRKEEVGHGGSWAGLPTFFLFSLFKLKLKPIEVK
jgi:hypothetical protein